MDRLLPWLRLLRIGNGFSPIADVIAGTCIAGASLLALDTARTAAASLAVYLAGMVLNDYADRHQDARERPERPLPRGQITPRAALIAGLGLLAFGLLIVPPAARWLLALITLGVLAYDFLVKQKLALGALLLGTLRALNLSLGAVGGAAALERGSSELLVLQAVSLAYFTYIVFLTLLAAGETKELGKPLTTILHLLPAVAMLAMTAWLRAPWPALALAAVFGVAVWRRWRQALRDWNPGTARRSVTTLLLGILVFDAVICLGHQQWLPAAVVLCMAPIARAISRRVAMT